MQENLLEPPVDIDAKVISRIHFTPYNFIGYNQPYDAECICTEYGISLKIFARDSVLPSVCGSGLFSKFILTTIDFHWPSNQKIILDKEFLEAQLVHYASKYGSFNNALKYKDGIAILSTFFMISKKSNDVTESIIQSIPLEELNCCQPVQLRQIITPRYFLPPKLGKFYRCHGSASEAYPNDTIIWTIFSVPSFITQEQLDRIKRIWTNVSRQQKNNHLVKVFHSKKLYISML